MILVTSSCKPLIVASKPSSAARLPSRSPTATCDAPYSAGFPIVFSTSYPSTRSWCWPAYTGTEIPRPGRVGETHNISWRRAGHPWRIERLRTRVAA
jgi:hypothetical protein